MKPHSLRFLAVALVTGLLFVGQALQAQESKPQQTVNFEYGKTQWFPTFWVPYTTPNVPPARMSNSDLLKSLIRDGKLHLSIENTIALALENNLDIAVSRFNIDYAHTDYLRAKGGGATRGFQGSFSSSALFAGAIGGGATTGGGGGTSRAGGAFGGGGATQLGGGNFDPTVGFSMGWDRNTTPLGTTVVSGVPYVTTQNTAYTGFYQQAFPTGTSFALFLSGYRQSSTSLTNLFNPQVNGTMGMGFTQPLLNGFGYRANAQFIRIAKNDLKVANSVFRQQVITSIANVLNLYWDYLSFQENVRVAQQALAYSQKLLSDNKRQVEIGTLAPIEVVRAEAEVASDEQNLIVAQTNLQKQGELIKTALAKNVGPDLTTVQIVPEGKLPQPQPDDIPTLDEALKLAMANRPEIEQADIELQDQEIAIEGARNRLLPTLNVFASYLAYGLSGNAVTRACPAGYIEAGILCQPEGGGVAIPPPVSSVVPGGVGQALTQTFHGSFPDYSFGVNLSIPLRNRQAQADAARALLERRQRETQLQQTKNNIAQEVRTAEIGVTQAKAQINAAVKAVELARQTLDAEQKKFQLGESTVFLVIQAQRDLTSAEGTEVTARSAYAKALTSFQSATATILDKYNVLMNDALSGHFTGVPNIPGNAAEPAPPKLTNGPQS
jgi:outer membrane protein